MYVRAYTLFSTLHPALLLFYALGAPILTMCGRNPVFQVVAFVCALLVQIFYMGGRNAARSLKGIIPVILLVALFNMLTNYMGITALFQIGSRIFTLESLCYGVSNGFMLGTVILWFGSFSALVPNHKFLYLFGRRFQKTGLLLSMILKLFPETRYKISCIRLAENQPAEEKPSLTSRIRKGMWQISALLEWSMEDGIETADSMRARGYAQGVRSSYERYAFTGGDGAVSVYLVLALVLSSCAVYLQNREFLYYPVLHWEIKNPAMVIAALLCEILFLTTPVWMEAWKKGGRARGWK